jgi:hypothetical protein
MVFWTVEFLLHLNHRLKFARDYRLLMRIRYARQSYNSTALPNGTADVPFARQPTVERPDFMDIDRRGGGPLPT